MFSPQTQNASLNQATQPGDLHSQIAAMVAAAQAGSPIQPQPAPMAPPALAAPAPAVPQATTAPQPGGAPVNIQRALLARAVRGG